MILVGVPRRAVLAKALPLEIIVGIDALPLPSAVTLDAEVVVALSCQTTRSSARLNQSLRHRDARRDLVTLHLANALIGIGTYIGLVVRIHRCLSPRGVAEQEQTGYREQRP